MVYSGKTGHIGGDLSVLNVLTVLYHRILNVDPNQPRMKGRDRFILSKGHCAEALYCVLADKGFIAQQELDEYGKDHAHLGGHPDVTIPGVEINTGALGHGLSAGVGMAYSQMPVKICGVSGGTAYSQLGATHHSLHDIAVLRTFPGMEVYLPCDVRQTRKLVERLKDHPKPVYVRVGRDAVPDVYDNDNFDLEPGKANTLMEGTDLTIIGTGETVAHCLEAGTYIPNHIAHQETERHQRHVHSRRRMAGETLARRLYAEKPLVLGQAQAQPL